MRYAKTFLATFAVAFAAFLATPNAVPATDSSIIVIGDDGSIEEVWIIVGPGGEIEAV